jgi:TRAP-type mannitol/chloroaromatic compound transport system permease large subunit
MSSLISKHPRLTDFHCFVTTLQVLFHTLETGVYVALIFLAKLAAIVAGVVGTNAARVIESNTQKAPQ